MTKTPNEHQKRRLRRRLKHKSSNNREPVETVQVVTENDTFVYSRKAKAEKVKIPDGLHGEYADLYLKIESLIQEKLKQAAGRKLSRSHTTLLNEALEMMRLECVSILRKVPAESVADTKENPQNVKNRKALDALKKREEGLQAEKEEWESILDAAEEEAQKENKSAHLISKDLNVEMQKFHVEVKERNELHQQTLHSIQYMMSAMDHSVKKMERVTMVADQVQTETMEMLRKYEFREFASMKEPKAIIKAMTQ